MPTLEQVTEFIYDTLEKTTISKQGTHFHSRCPFCGDSKKSKSKKRFHLTYYSENSIKFNCFNCSESGNFYKLYAHIEGITEREAGKRFNRYNSNNIKSKLKSDQNQTRIRPNQTRNNISELKDLTYILDNCISSEDEVSGILIPKYQKILKNFIKERKINKTLYYCYNGDFSHRIIIPIWYNNKVIYFQARRTSEEQEPKYLNPSVDKSNIILNINSFDKDKYICIVEGIIDAYSVDNQGTPMLGKELNIELINTVERYTDKGIIIIMDNDKDGMKKLDEIIYSFRDRFLYFLVPYKYKNYKDINDIYVNENINIYDYIVKNSYNWRISIAKLKMEKWRGM